MTKKQGPHSTFRLSPEARRILRELARQLGVTMTAVLELALREKAARERRRG
jgi:hypothetical protein